MFCLVLSVHWSDQYLELLQISGGRGEKVEDKEIRHSLSVRAHTGEVISEKNMRWNSSCCRVSGTIYLWWGMSADLGEQLCWLEPSRRLVMSGEGGDSQQTAYYSLVSDEGLFPQPHLSLSKYQPLISMKVHPFISADGYASLNDIFTCCTRFACMNLRNWYRKADWDRSSEGSQPTRPCRFMWKYQRH